MKIRTFYIQTLLLFLSGIVVTSCQKVIDIDLNSTDPIVVVEGSVSTTDTVAIVRLSYTINFDEPNAFPPVENADVTITDSEGTVYKLLENTTTILHEGVMKKPVRGYYGCKLQGQVGRTYTLNIVSNGKTYTSTSIIHPPVPIDSLYVSDTGGFNPPDMPSTYMQCEFRDPKGVKNNYRLIQTVNDTIDNYIFVGDDQLQDGDYIKASLFGTDKGFDKGDTVTVALQSIDKGVGDYFTSLAQITQDGGGSASPTNPKTNITGGALGYFSAYSEVVDTLIIK